MNKRKRTSPIWTIEKQELEKLVDQCSTMTEVLNYFGLKNKGGNHRTLKNRLEYEDIDYQKFKDNFRKGRINPIIPLDKILVQESEYSRTNLKRRLINNNLLENKCSNCGLGPEWDGKFLVMILDHINGIPNDHRLSNLRLLCPNCNSQTQTFSGKKNTITKLCQCGQIVCKNRSQCLACSKKSPRYNSRKVERPSKEVLQKMLWEKPTIQLASELGVSDTCICKWAKAYQIDKPPRGYWGFK